MSLLPTRLPLQASLTPSSFSSPIEFRVLSNSQLFQPNRVATQADLVSLLIKIQSFTPTAPSLHFNQEPFQIPSWLMPLQSSHPPSGLYFENTKQLATTAQHYLSLLSNLSVSLSLYTRKPKLTSLTNPLLSAGSTVALHRLRRVLHPLLLVQQVQKVLVCQICERDHLAHKCPFIYTKCKIQGCGGIRILKESNTETNKGRKFLKCQHISCAGFQWLDNAIDESIGTMGSSSYTLQGCFLCGSSDHWKVDCPWSSTRCHHCHGVVTLKVSGKKESEGRRYLKCGGCDHFEWFTPLVKPTTSKMKMTIEGSLDDLCNMFQNTCTHK